MGGLERTYDKPRLDKLGVKPGSRVAILGVEDAKLRSELGERTDDVTDGHPRPATDLILLAADSLDELGSLRELRARLKPDGAIWVVSRKGKAATIRDMDVIDAAVASDLIDNKVVSFSDTHTALRLVIPRAMRAAHGG